jgi:hypothetical protein
MSGDPQATLLGQAKESDPGPAIVARHLRRSASGGLAFDKNGNLYVTNSLISNNQLSGFITEYSPAGGYLGVFASAGQTKPNRLRCGPAEVCSRCGAAILPRP